jgi:hypothetical protein
MAVSWTRPAIIAHALALAAKGSLAPRADTGPIEAVEIAAEGRTCQTRAESAQH